MAHGSVDEKLEFKVIGFNKVPNGLLFRTAGSTRMLSGGDEAGKANVQARKRNNRQQWHACNGKDHAG